MRIKIKACGASVLVATAFLALLAPLVLPAISQPQDYTLVYPAPRAYDGADWMDVKAFYMKTENNRLYFYAEYYGEVPKSGDYRRQFNIIMDTDRNSETGTVSWCLLHCNYVGMDYIITFSLYGNNSSCYATLERWNNASKSWDWENPKDLRQNVKLAPGLSYMEVWVDQQDIGYTTSGIELCMTTYSEVKAIPETRLSYTIGSSVKQITVDGDASDWGTVAPSATLPSRSINPPELEVSSIYFANDDENLYIRIDTRGTPATSINTGYLDRWLYLYFDTDNNRSTGDIGYGGAEFRAYPSFSANPSKSTGVTYYRYAGTQGGNWQKIAEDPSASDFNSVFETKIPLSYLGIGSGQKVGIYIPERWWSLHRWSPKLAYPATTPTPTPMSTPTPTTSPTSTPTPTPTPTLTPTPTPSSATGFLSSEIVLIAVIVIVVILSIIIMRRRRAPPPPPTA